MAFRIIPVGTSTIDIYSINDSGQAQLSGVNFVMLEVPRDSKAHEPLNYTIGIGMKYSDGTNDFKQFDLNDKPPPNTKVYDLRPGKILIRTDSTWTYVKTPTYGLGNENPVIYDEDTILIEYGTSAVAPFGPRKIRVSRDSTMENNVKKFMDLYV
jgi:hypothetical protein